MSLSIERQYQSALSLRIHTLIPQIPIPIAHPPRPRLDEIEDADAETHIVQDPISVFGIELGGERVLGGHSKRRGVDRNRVL